MFYYHIYVNFGGQNKNGYSLWFKSTNDLGDEDAIIDAAVSQELFVDAGDDEWVETAEQTDEEDYRQATGEK